MTESLKDIRTAEAATLRAMVRLHCRVRHRRWFHQELCEICAELLDYALRRLDACRFGDAKPVCSACPVHWYSPRRREQIRAVMRWAGPRMILVHPVMAVRHLRHKRRPLPPSTPDG